MRTFDRKQGKIPRGMAEATCAGAFIHQWLSRAVLLPVLAGAVMSVGVAAPASAQAGCSLSGAIQIEHPYRGDSYHFVLLSGYVTCSKQVTTKVTEVISRNVSILPDQSVESKQWRGRGTGSRQLYQIGIDCTNSNKGQKFHGDIFLNWGVGLQTGPTQHVKTRTVTC
jgi:hypothetical protein